MDVEKKENESKNVSMLEINATARSDRLKRLRNQVSDTSKENEDNDVKT